MKCEDSQGSYSCTCLDGYERRWKKTDKEGCKSKDTSLAISYKACCTFMGKTPRCFAFTWPRGSVVHTKQPIVSWKLWKFKGTCIFGPVMLVCWQINLFWKYTVYIIPSQRSLYQLIIQIYSACKIKVNSIFFQPCVFVITSKLGCVITRKLCAHDLLNHLIFSFWEYRRFQNLCFFSHRQSFQASRFWLTKLPCLSPWLWK